MNGRYVQLDAVLLGWPPEQVPPLIISARGPETVALAGEVGDGVLLDAPAHYAEYVPSKYVASEAVRVAEVRSAHEPTNAAGHRPRRNRTRTYPPSATVAAI